MPPKKSLSPKQLKFAHFYAVHGNASQAAEQAGYSKNSCGALGERNTRNPEIMAIVNGSLKKIAEKSIIDAGYVLDQAIKMHEMYIDSDPAVALKALEIIGKHKAISAFDKSINITGDLNLTQIKRVIINANS